jgi:hypothetical protein
LRTFITSEIKALMGHKQKAKLGQPQKANEYYSFIEWVALPEPLRKPATQQELAAQLNLDEGTLSDWKRREDFWPQVRAEVRRWARGNTANVVDALYRRIIRTGEPASVRLWLEAFSQDIPPVQSKPDPVTNLLRAYGLATNN